MWQLQRSGPVRGFDVTRACRPTPGTARRECTPCSSRPAVAARPSGPPSHTELQVPPARPFRNTQRSVTPPSGDHLYKIQWKWRQRSIPRPAAASGEGCVHKVAPSTQKGARFRAQFAWLGHGAGRLSSSCSVQSTGLEGACTYHETSAAPNRPISATWPGTPTGPWLAVADVRQFGTLQGHFTQERHSVRSPWS